LKTNNAHFTPGVQANVQLKSSIPIGAKVEISPQGFTRGVKAEIEKVLSICPKLLINFVALYWPQAWKKNTIQFGKPICKPGRVGMLNRPKIVYAVSTKVLLQIFPPVCPLIFFSIFSCRSKSGDQPPEDLAKYGNFKRGRL